MSSDELGRRMKSYEKTGRQAEYLDKDKPVIIRVDGRAFHTFARKLNKPFDDLLIDAMESTMQYLCKNVGGCVLGYCQSDEISLLLQSYKTEETQPFFGYRTDKLCSIVASLATFAFNRAFTNYTMSFYDACSADEDVFADNKERIDNLIQCCDKGAIFDARAFNLPFEEVTNYFYWREADAIRNSIEMVGHANFSQKELHKVNCDGIKAKLLSEKGIDYDKLPISKQRGICCIKAKIPAFAPDGRPIMKTSWVTDINIPVFRGDDRDYIESKIGDDYFDLS